MRTPRRRFLIVGIDYAGTGHALTGTLQDAACVRDMALGLGWDVRALLSTAATASAIADGWRWLCAEAGASATFYFSGHGVEDPALLSADLVHLTRDMMHTALVQPALDAGVDLTVILDSCHSGGMMGAPLGGCVSGSVVFFAAAAARQVAGDGAQSVLYDPLHKLWVVSTPHGTFTRAVLDSVRCGDGSNADVYRTVRARLMKLQSPAMTATPPTSADRRFCLAKNL